MTERLTLLLFFILFILNVLTDLNPAVLIFIFCLFSLFFFFFFLSVFHFSFLYLAFLRVTWIFKNFIPLELSEVFLEYSSSLCHLTV